MRVTFIGSVLFSRTVLAALASLPGVEIAGVVTRTRAPQSGDFACLSSDAEALDVPCLTADDCTDSELEDWIRQTAPDVIFCIGWNRLLRANILDIPKKGVVGYHPTALPENRGRHPIIWALALGLDRTASSFFLMDTGADTGAIIDQEPIAISPDDDAATLYARLEEIAPVQIRRFVPKLLDGSLIPQPQNPEDGNSWRKRTPADGQIDWRMSAHTIQNLVRALTHPYPGATCRHAENDVIIWKAEVVTGTPQNLEPGKVLESGSNGVLVKCGTDALRIVTHTFDPLPQPGSYL
jgi:methionyl-tRNA formyltransferase